MIKLYDLFNISILAKQYKSVLMTSIYFQYNN